MKLHCLRLAVLRNRYSVRVGEKVVSTTAKWFNICTNSLTTVLICAYKRTLTEIWITRVWKSCTLGQSDHFMYKGRPYNTSTLIIFQHTCIFKHACLTLKDTVAEKMLFETKLKLQINHFTIAEVLKLCFTVFSVSWSIHMFSNEVYSYQVNLYTHPLTLLQNSLFQCEFQEHQIFQIRKKSLEGKSSVQKSATMAFVSEP